MTKVGEWETIATLARGHNHSNRVRVGIGDDCAVVRLPSSDLVVTTDACIENVHYRSGWLTKRELAKKAMGAAVSDLAAMGARPLAVVCHLTLPRETTRAELAAFARGQREFCAETDCELVGGNISSGATFDIVTTAFGTPSFGKKTLLRSGARVGDEVWLIGTLGYATLGLRILGSKERTVLPSRAKAKALAAFRTPRPLLKEGAALLKVANSALDVSDGLVGDANHLAKASNVKLRLAQAALEDLVEPQMAKLALILGIAPLEAALYGGEDYALLATGPRKRRPSFARVIGSVEAGAGVFLDDARRPLKGGFQHRF